MIKYVHTNIVANDWKSLSQFYIDVFECERVPPERHLHGEWIENMTGVKGGTIDGVHLRLPGFTEGPTLEIFQYTPSGKSNLQMINNQGFAHIAYHVDSVEDMIKKILNHGGSRAGDMIIKDYEGIGTLTAAYMRDPEGNLIEIQNWSR